MNDDDVELRRLRAEVYGTAGASAAPETIARLTELEEAARLRAAGPPTAEAPTTAADASETASLDDGHVPERPRRSAVVWAIGGASAVVLLAIGFAAGTATSSLPAASPSPTSSAGSDLPELAFPQTDEDIISAGLLDDSGIDPSTTRYIAQVRGFRVYLAARAQGDGVCVVTFAAADNTPWSAGCATGGSFTDGAVFGVNEGLSIAIGDTSSMSITGAPVRLSATVTAYLSD